MDISEVEVLSYLSLDPDTRVIAIHLESIEEKGGNFSAHPESLPAQTRGRAQVRSHGRRERKWRLPTPESSSAETTWFLTRPETGRGHRAPEHRRVFSLPGPGSGRFGPYRFKGTRLAVATLPGGRPVVVPRPLPPGWFFPPPVFRKDPGEAEGGFSSLGHYRCILSTWGSPSNSTTPGRVYLTLLDAVAEDPNVGRLAIQLSPPDCERPDENFSTLSSCLKTSKPIALCSPDPVGRDDRSSGWRTQHVPSFPSPEKAPERLFALQPLQVCGKACPPETV